MNTYRKLLIFMLLLTMLASGCSSKANKPFTQIIAFGDSLSYNGKSSLIKNKDDENKVTDGSVIPPSDLN